MFQNSDMIAIDDGSNDLNAWKPPSGSTSGTTGGTCTKTGLYKSSDGKIEFIEYFAAGDIFFPFPGGRGTKSCTWTRLTVTSDGGKASFDSVLVEAGTA